MPVIVKSFCSTNSNYNSSENREEDKYNIMGKIDLFIIFIYMVIMLAIGLSYSGKVRNTEDFFLAGRSLGLFTMIATVCATIIGGGALIGRGGEIFSRGLTAIWLPLPYFIGMLGFSLIAHRINKIGRKHGISSIPDLMNRRFDSATRIIFSVLIAYTMMATVGSQISATATIVSIVGGQWGISYEMGAFVAALIFVLYTSAAGLFGVVYTDVVQFIMLIISVYIILPIIVLSKIGGVPELLAQIPAEMKSLGTDSTIVGYIFTNLLFSFAGAEMWQRAFASKNEKTARQGMFWGTFAYGLTIISTMIIGLSAYVLLPNLVETYGTTDAAIPVLIVSCLPVGLSGITVAGLLAIMMSSSDSYLLISTQTIIDDIIKHIRPSITQKTELKMSRIITPILGFGALIIALYIKSAYAALMFAWTFYAASVGLPAFAALFWKKATKAGIISSVLTGFFISLLWRLLNSPMGIADALAGGIACAIVLVSVSLLTYREGKYELIS
jgi:SSS family solute:Na+ symporter